MEFRLHPGQKRALQSNARFVAVIAGTQSGKTVLGPVWLLDEVNRRGPGDYLAVSPSYPLLALKALPEFLALWQTALRLGEYAGSPSKVFTLSPRGEQFLFGAPQSQPTRVVFGHAGDPDSLESATAKAAWLDEAGQKRFRLGSWEAVQRRLAVHRGRALITTTPYDLGWLKQQVHDRWKAGDRDYDVIRFDSTENPAFPREEFERARATLPRWKFDLYYRAVFTKPAGMIYDCFDDDAHVCPRFAIPEHWPRYLGLDFGPVNTAAVFFAEEVADVTGPPRPGDESGRRKTGRLFAYREYHAGGRSSAEHVKAILAGEAGVPIAVGGSKTEQGWRDAFAAAGLPVREPDQGSVDVGIDRVYAAFKRNQLVIMSDLAGLLDEVATYSREVDEKGDPTDKIDDKSAYHRCDAARYVVGWLKRGRPDWKLRVL